MSSKAVNDVRATSFDAASHRPEGYQGTIDDVIAQIRAEPDVARPYWALNMSPERYELLGFLGILKVPQQYGPWRNRFMAKVEDDTVEYGVPEAADGPSPYSLEYAQRNFPGNFVVRS